LRHLRPSWGTSNFDLKDLCSAFFKHQRQSVVKNLGALKDRDAPCCHWATYLIPRALFRVPEFPVSRWKEGGSPSQPAGCDPRWPHWPFVDPLWWPWTPFWVSLRGIPTSNATISRSRLSSQSLEVGEVLLFQSLDMMSGLLYVATLCGLGSIVMTSDVIFGLSGYNFGLQRWLCCVPGFPSSRWR